MYTQNAWGAEKFYICLLEKVERIPHKWLIYKLGISRWAGESWEIKVGS